jgi:hypothetical protein
MSSQVLTTNTESAILARILQADEQELTLDAARYWLSVKIPASDQDRVDELSAKARAGSLTEAETQELDNYLHIDFLLSTMQAKARRLLPMESTLPPQWIAILLKPFERERESVANTASSRNRRDSFAFKSTTSSLNSTEAKLS